MNDTNAAKGRWKELAMGYDEALARLPDALKKEGFGIITQIDLQETFKAKLGKDFRRYRIFGACNPNFAFDALQKEPHVGVLLPCNVVLYERDDGKAVLGAVDPMQTLGAVDPMQTLGAADDPGLAGLAREVGAKLERFLGDFSG